MVVSAEGAIPAGGGGADDDGAVESGSSGRETATGGAGAGVVAGTEGAGTARVRPEVVSPAGEGRADEGGLAWVEAAAGAGEGGRFA